MWMWCTTARIAVVIRLLLTAMVSGTHQFVPPLPGEAFFFPMPPGNPQVKWPVTNTGRLRRTSASPEKPDPDPGVARTYPAGIGVSGQRAETRLQHR